MDKVYVIFQKDWIEDHYEINRIVEDFVFRTEEAGVEYIKSDVLEECAQTIEEGVTYYHEPGHFSGNEGMSFYYVKGIPINASEGVKKKGSRFKMDWEKEGVNYWENSACPRDYLETALVQLVAEVEGVALEEEEVTKLTEADLRKEVGRYEYFADK